MGRAPSATKGYLLVVISGLPLGHLGDRWEEPLRSRSRSTYCSPHLELS